MFFYTVLLCTVFACSSVPMNRTTEKDNLLIFRLNLRVYEKKIRKDPDNYRLYYEREIIIVCRDTIMRHWRI